MARLTFEERNQNNYIKYSDTSIETINKYKGKLPDELLNIWNIMGYGIYENGFIQLVNPDDYDFVFKYNRQTIRAFYSICNYSNG